MRPSRVRARQLLLRRQLLLTVRRADAHRPGTEARSREQGGPGLQPHQPHQLSTEESSVRAERAAGGVDRAPVVRTAVHAHGTDGATAQVWRELTERQVALCRQDRQRWAKVMDRAEALQTRGLPASQAVRQALDEAGA